MRTPITGCGGGHFLLAFLVPSFTGRILEKPGVCSQPLGPFGGKLMLERLSVQGGWRGDPGGSHRLRLPRLGTSQQPRKGSPQPAGSGAV